MSRAYEMEALKLKYEKQSPCIVTVEIALDPDPDARVKNGLSFGSFGHTHVYGKMTEVQRHKFIFHIERYIKLMFDESEAAVKFRQEWDMIQDEIDEYGK